jgi:hypothetical protein
VRLSAFRRVERLPGAAHPAVFCIAFRCSCGDEHIGLVTQTQLDWEPLGLDSDETFVNLMTSRRDDLAAELGDLAGARINAGEWPWTFFCYPEERPRPVTPSCFVLLTPGAELRHGRVGLVVRCPVCDALSINVVSEPHVDLPFWNDAHVGVVEHVFHDDAVRTIEAFRSELHSATFDERRLTL